jgi:DNA-binding Xre family transcriptional regulator
MGNRKVTISQRIRASMRVKNVSVHKLAEKLGITPQAAYYRLNNDFSWKVADVKRVSSILNVKVEDLI